MGDWRLRGYVRWRGCLRWKGPQEVGVGSPWGAVAHWQDLCLCLLLRHALQASLLPQIHLPVGKTFAQVQMMMMGLSVRGFNTCPQAHEEAGNAWQLSIHLSCTKCVAAQDLNQVLHNSRQCTAAWPQHPLISQSQAISKYI